jgi:hypothetical protein
MQLNKESVSQIESPFFFSGICVYVVFSLLCLTYQEMTLESLPMYTTLGPN